MHPLRVVVLVSGVLVSPPVIAIVGEQFGRVRVWSEIHGGFNFVLVVFVGLHLALNWDWIIAALRRRRPERPALTSTPCGNAINHSKRRSRCFAGLLLRRRGCSSRRVPFLGRGLSGAGDGDASPERSRAGASQARSCQTRG
jgi:hypothetical protein